jgi:hypothetical protein
MNSKEFSLKIEGLVKERRCTYMEAVLLYCEENEIDPSTTKPLISKALKEKIKLEAVDLRLLKEKPSGKLPV